MPISIGDVVQAISLVDGTIRRGIVTGFSPDGAVHVQMSSFHTLCKDPQKIDFNNFDPNQRWWLGVKKEELLREQLKKETQTPAVIHYE